MLRRASKNTLGGMSFKEKSNWLTIVTLLLAFGTYFGSVWSERNTVDPLPVGTLVAATLIFIVVQATVQGVLAAVLPEEARQRPTELERQADQKAHRVAYLVLVFGVFAAFVLLLAGASALWLFQTVLFFFVLAELTRFVTEIITLRRTLPR